MSANAPDATSDACSVPELPAWHAELPWRWQLVTAVDDPQLEEIRATQSKRPPPGPRAKGEQRPFIVDGVEVVARLLDAAVPVHRVYLPQISLERLRPHLFARAARVGCVGPELIVLTDDDTLATAGGLAKHGIPSHRIAFAALPAISLPATPASAAKAVAERVADRSAPLRFLALDGLTDAMNVGALVRLAAAFEATAVLCSSDCCDPFTVRAVRASQGHVFHVPIVRGDLPAIIRDLRSQHSVVTAAAVVQDDTIFLDELDSVSHRWAFVVGSEHFGVSAAVRDACERLVKIRMAPGVDSLNVTASAGVILHGCIEREGPA